MRLIAKLQLPITGPQIRCLQALGANVIFCSAYAGIVGVDMEDDSLYFDADSQWNFGIPFWGI